jgi:DNA-binding PadR family transcriptional regulator
MTFEPDPLQVLFLWGLLARGGEGWKSDIKPKLDRRNKYLPLVRAGFIEEESRKNPDTGKEKGWIRLSDQGWAWAQDHLDADVSQTKTAAPILQGLLARLKPYLKRHDIPLAEVLGPTPEAADLPQRIRDAYLRASGGQWNTRVRLADLRAALSDVPQATLDNTLLSLGREQRLALYPLDNPREISDADRSAAINVVGQVFHIVYMSP